MTTALSVVAVLLLLATLAGIDFRAHRKSTATRAGMCPDCGIPGRVIGVDVDGARWMTCPWDGSRWDAGVAP